jgi:hypothetical protein
MEKTVFNDILTFSRFLGAFQAGNGIPSTRFASKSIRFTPSSNRFASKAFPFDFSSTPFDPK